MLRLQTLIPRNLWQFLGIGRIHSGNLIRVNAALRCPAKREQYQQALIVLI
jgi:hypothetical protein